MAKRRLTTEEFIEKATLAHADAYNYEKVVYELSRIPVCIICPKHGEFWQIPNNHLRGAKCTKCSGKGKTCEDVISEFKNIHGDRYNYENFELINFNTKSSIICPDHGEFLQTAHKHKQGRGCPKCIGRYKSNKDIISEFKQEHGNNYDYSKVEYVNSRSKVCIICPKHGEFWQSPDNHKKAHGCPLCKSSIGENKISKLLRDRCIYFIPQYSFKECRYKQKLPFDFYIPSKNLLIEYDGEQHFKPVDFFGGESGFELRKACDSIKNDFAKNHNMKLIRIPYYDFDNLELIINNI